MKKNPLLWLVIITIAIFFICIGFLNLSLPIVVLIEVVFLASCCVIFYPSAIAILGNLFYIRDNEKRARPLLKRAIELNTKSPSAHYYYALILMRKGSAFEAMDCLNKALELNTKPLTEKNILLSIGSCHWQLGQIDKAIEVLEGMRARYEYINSHVLVTLGYMYLLKEDFEKAEDFTIKAITDSPESAAAWDNLGQVYFRIGNNTKAKESFEKALEFKSTLADSLYYMGLIAEAENDFEKAAEYFKRASNSNITALNTVTKEMIAEKLK